MNMLEVRNLKKSFGDVNVLDGVSFSVDQGEVVAVIGPSGGGKSTMLRCLIGLEYADGGDILVEGESLMENGIYAPDQRMRHVCAKMGMVFQAFNLFPHMTVLENLMAAPISVLKLSKSQALTLALERLNEVGLGDKANVHPRALSGGQKQRVAIARALMMQPDILLFDEPTSSLDPQLTAEVLAVMKKLVAKRMTMVIVTHEMAFAKEAADKVLFMCDREVVEQGPTAALFSHPKDPRTRDFIHSIL